MPEIVQEIGAYAGLASVFGLAVLSVLYFSQARDVKRLREWAGRAPERAGEPGPAVPGRVVAQPQPGTPGAPAVPGPKPGAPAVPGAKPGVPGPPGAKPPGVPVPGAQPGAAAAPAAKPPGVPLPGQKPAVAAAAGAATAAAQGKQADGAGAAAPAVPAGAQAAPAKPGPPGVPQPGKPGVPQPGKPGSPATPAGGRPPGAPPLPPGPAPRPPARPVPQQTAIIPPPRDPWYRRLVASPRYVALVAAGVLVLGGAAAFAITQIASDDDGGATQGGQPRDDGRQLGNDDAPDDDQGAKRRTVNPSRVTVAVLNGTTVPGLAATIADEVKSFGFQIGTVANSPDQESQRAESVVLFSPGKRREAQEVSRRLKISQRQPVDPESQGLAGDASVVVIAGGDRTDQ